MTSERQILTAIDGSDTETEAVVLFDAENFWFLWQNDQKREELSKRLGMRAVVVRIEQIARSLNWKVIQRVGVLSSPALEPSVPGRMRVRQELMALTQMLVDYGYETTILPQGKNAADKKIQRRSDTFLDMDEGVDAFLLITGDGSNPFPQIVDDILNHHNKRVHVVSYHAIRQTMRRPRNVTFSLIGGDVRQMVVETEQPRGAAIRTPQKVTDQIAPRNIPNPLSILKRKVRSFARDPQKIEIEPHLREWIQRILCVFRAQLINEEGGQVPAYYGVLRSLIVKGVAEWPEPRPSAEEAAEIVSALINAGDSFERNDIYRFNLDGRLVQWATAQTSPQKKS